jgi:glutamate racemase
MHSSDLPIGVFDSGVGGLTVLKALRAELPREHFIYLGDTARLPYGTKTPNTVSAYAIQAVNFLLKQGIKFLVVACNTASALALPVLQAHFPELPMMGVIAPGAETALKVSGNKRIAVIATQATVSSKGYEEAIFHLDAQAQVLAQSAMLLVAFAEEGLLTGDITKLTVQHYLTPILKNKAFAADTLILGCTHFPVLYKTIHEVVAQRMHIVDSAHSVARKVKIWFDEHPELLMPEDKHLTAPVRFLVTDGIGRFRKTAEIFLAEPVVADEVSLVDL